MAKYSLEFKREIVKAYLNGEVVTIVLLKNSN
jgi:transposase-like protein